MSLKTPSFPVPETELPEEEPFLEDVQLRIHPAFDGQLQGVGGGASEAPPHPMPTGILQSLEMGWS